CIERCGRTIERIADPIGTELAGQVAVNASAAHYEDATIPMTQHLNGEMRRSAKTVEPHGRAGFDSRPAYCAKADNTGTEQRCRVLVVDRIRQPVREIFAHDGILGIAAVAIPAGKERVGAKVFAPFPTVGAGAARLA